MCSSDLYNLSQSTALTDAGTFSLTGQHPGITDDGNYVAFVGTVGTNNVCLGAGSGLFLSIFTNGQWTTRRVLGTNDSQGNQLFQRFHEYYRTSVASLIGQSNTLKICFGAASPTGRVGLYAAVYDMRSNAVSSITTLVEAARDVAGLGLASGFELFDSVNACGDVAFWVQTPQGDAVVQTISGPSITLHRLLPEALVASSTDGVDESLEVSTRSPGLLFLQPRVTEGLVADGVTPLLLQLSNAAPLVQPTTYTVRLTVDTASGSLGKPIEEHLYVLRAGAFVRDDKVTLSTDSPIGFAYIKGIAAEDLQLNPGHTHLSLRAAMDSADGVGCPVEIKLSRPPIVLVHGYNADKSTWSDLFKAELLQSRSADFVIPIDYGVNGTSSKNFFNTYGPLEKLAAVLDNVLRGTIESPTSVLRDKWAFTRYDVVGHSQGGVLARLLCTESTRCIPPFADCISPFRSSANFYRGRFHRVVTIGSPHNGSTAVYYVFRVIETSSSGSWFAEQILDKWKGVLQPKFDPFRREANPFHGEITEVNTWPIDEAAKFHCIRSTVPACPWQDGLLPWWVYLEGWVNICDDCGTGTPRRTVVLPAGSDGIVDLDSQGGGYNPPFTPVTDFLASGVLGGISHAGPELVFGVQSGATQTASPFVASEARYLLDGATNNFGRFPQPPRLTEAHRSIIDSCVPYFDVDANAEDNVVGHHLVFPTQMFRAAGVGGLSSYDFTLTRLPNRPLQGSVAWFAQSFGTNGASTDGISLTVSSNDSTHVSVTVDDAVRGDVVLYATYPSTNGIVVVASPIVVVSRPVGTGLAGIELVPSPGALAVGQWSVPEIWGVSSNGLRSRLFISPTNGVVVSSSAPGIVEIGSNGLARAVGAGAATLTANYRDFTAQAQVSVGVIPTTTATLTNLALRPDTIYLFDYARTKQVEVYGQFSDGIERNLAAGEQRWITIDPAVATVTTNGLVEARAVGQTTLLVRNGPFAASAPIVVLGAPFTNAPPRLTQHLEIIDLGTNLRLKDINNAGQVLVFQLAPILRPAIWENGVFKPFSGPVEPTPVANALTESGVAGGGSAFGPTLWMTPSNLVTLNYTSGPISFERGGTVSDLQDTDHGLSGFVNLFGPCGIAGCPPPTTFRFFGTDAGQVFVPQGIPPGFLWGGASRMNRHGVLIGGISREENGTLVSELAVSINRSNQVTLLPQNRFGRAMAINDAGDIVGAVSYGGSYSDAALWRDGTLTLLWGGEWAQAAAINNRGHVGIFRNDGRTAIWSNGRIVTLQQLLGTNSVWSGFYPIAAMNDNGWLICDGLFRGQSYRSVLIKLGPVVQDQPISRTKVPGQTVSFSVVSYGIGDIEYQWRHNGTNLANGPRFVGADSPVLTINDIYATDAGTYDLCITDSYGTVVSSNATLTIFAEGCLPATNGLVAHWTADGTGQEVLNRYRATLVNGAGFQTGIVNQAFHFDGVSGYLATDLDVGTNIMPVTTWEAWVFPTGDFSSGRTQIILSDTDAFGYSGPRGVGIAGGRFVIHPANTGVAPVSTNEWQHIAVVFYPGGIEFYKNGERFSVNSPPVVMKTSTFAIGASRGVLNTPFYNFFEGLVDEVSIYNRALSQPEIQAIYEVGYAGKCLPVAPPRITTQPPDQITYPGFGVTYAVGTFGSAPLSYQWYFDSTNLIANATNAQFRIPNAQAGNAGTYRVVVSNRLGVVTSDMAKLEVLSACEGQWRNRRWSLAAGAPSNRWLLTTHVV